MPVETLRTNRLASTSKMRAYLNRTMREAAAEMAKRRRDLGGQVRQARLDKKWKQKQLAAAVNVEPTTVSRWETGTTAPDLEMIDLIAKATDKPFSFFVVDDEPTTPVSDRYAEELAKIRELLEELLRRSA